MQHLGASGVYNSPSACQVLSLITRKRKQPIKAPDWIVSQASLRFSRPASFQRTGSRCEGNVTAMQWTRFEVLWRMSILWHLLPLFSAFPVILTCCFPRQIRFDILVRGHEKYEEGEWMDYSVSHVLFIEISLLSDQVKLCYFSVIQQRLEFLQWLFFIWLQDVLNDHWATFFYFKIIFIEVLTFLMDVECLQ